MYSQMRFQQANVVAGERLLHEIEVKPEYRNLRELVGKSKDPRFFESHFLEPNKKVQCFKDRVNRFGRVLPLSYESVN